MDKVSKNVVIDAPPKKVFDYLTEAAHLLAIWPSLVEVSHEKIERDGGHSFDWIYKMAGMRFRGHAETVEVERDRLRLVRNASGIPSTFRWTFDAREGGTDLALEIEYELPIRSLVFAEPLLRRLNEREADTLVHNLKARMEASRELAPSAS